MSPSQLSVSALADAVNRRERSAADVTRHFLDRADQLDPALGCFLHRDRDDALAQAAAVDRAVAGGARLPLAGVPVGLKDALCTRGVPTTCGSRMLAGWRPPYDATVVERLRQAGAVLVGKMNMDEFAMGSSNENSAFQPCHNPWDPARVPGGSSGGSAAAVAADLCPLTLGSDTGGSVRQPAALCGVTGLKPTYGRVSRYGLVAFASSLDQIGVLTRSARDAALALQVIGGHDRRDPTSVPQPLPDLTAACDQPLLGLRIGVADEYFAAGLDPQIAGAVKQAIDDLVAAGATRVPISLPMTRHAVAVYYLVATAEASSNLARFDGVRYGLRAEGSASLVEMYERTRAAGFGPEVKRRIMLGTYVLRSGYYDAYYRRASQVRTLLARDFAQAFTQCDVIATPTSPVPAFRGGERTADPLAMYLADIYTLGASLAGLPGISVPCGLWRDGSSGAGLPIGLQLLGRPLDEATVLRAAAGYQGLRDWHTRRPPLPGPGSPTEAA